MAEEEEEEVVRALESDFELTNHQHASVEKDEGRSNMIFVAEPGEPEHDERSEDIGRRNETLRGGDIEAHARIENDGQEIGDGVGIGGCKAKESGEAPNLQVEGVLEVFANVKFLWDCIVTILLDAGNDESRLLLVQELEPKAVS